MKLDPVSCVCASFLFFFPVNNGLFLKFWFLYFFLMFAKNTSNSCWFVISFILSNNEIIRCTFLILIFWPVSSVNQDIVGYVQDFYFLTLLTCMHFLYLFYKQMLIRKIQENCLLLCFDFGISDTSVIDLPFYNWHVVLIGYFHKLIHFPFFLHTIFDWWSLPLNFRFSALIFVWEEGGANTTSVDSVCGVKR